MNRTHEKVFGFYIKKDMKVEYLCLYYNNGERKEMDMKYDFTTIMDRSGKDALAIDNVGQHMWGNEPEAPKEGFDFIPMWVADMNFPTCPSVTEAIIERAKHPAFGYFVPRQEYFDKTIKWQEVHHKVTGLTEEVIGYENGVHGCVTSAVQVLPQPGDCILLNSPVCVGFAADVDGIGRRSALIANKAMNG